MKKNQFYSHLHIIITEKQNAKKFEVDWTVLSKVMNVCVLTKMQKTGSEKNAL